MVEIPVTWFPGHGWILATDPKKKTLFIINENKSLTLCK